MESKLKKIQLILPKGSLENDHRVLLNLSMRTFYRIVQTIILNFIKGK